MSLSYIGQSFWSLPTILLLSVVVRVALILYSEWHDARSLVKYTDIDYRVFSDAAAYLVNPSSGADNHAKGWAPLGLGDPYSRDTYRYTPLLALLLAPNEWVHPSFGKYLFAGCDIVNGIIIYRILVTIILPATYAPVASENKSDGPPAPAPTPESAQCPSLSSSEIRTLATKYAAVHFLNPMVFTISTRGSSESILSLFVLMTLYAALTRRWGAAAVLLGLSTHWKIYPGVYGVACIGAISAGRATSFGSLVNTRTIAFGLTSLMTFFALGLGCYTIWGEPFLQQSYLYHLHRLDHRHNFSPYFYLTYLTYPPASSLPSPTLFQAILRSPLVSFVPQMTLTLGSGLLFGRQDDLVFAWFVQTAVFVIFNKVCTSQYFLWYLLLLPVLLPSLHMSRWMGVASVIVWVAVQGLWLNEAYKLEFLGENVFFGLWVRGLIYVAGNCWVLGAVINAYKRG